ncbi:MAG: hypothetical protein JXR05_06430 [Flavobacteriaceae bacterium]
MNSIKKNTPQKGSVRIIVFQDKQDMNWYGVALDFNIVVSAQNHVAVLHELYEAMDGYIETVASFKGVKDYSCLNQKGIKEYEELWSLLIKGKSVPSPYQVEFHGLKEIHA